ncbi:transposase [Saccharopolyspora gregorii]|uniref:transposase n=1 Tax=Saccharopolyspora gregorii TaxID=33914 RepID=UPI0021AC05CC|nr:transposase [Saccharopolyspora gregorii]
MRRQYSPGFREFAVAVATQSASPLVRVADELGVKRTTLSSWIAAARRHRVQTPRLRAPEVAALQKKIERISAQRDALAHVLVLCVQEKGSGGGQVQLDR